MGQGGFARPVGSGVGVGGTGGEIEAALGAQAFLRRRDAVADAEGVYVYFGPTAAGETAIAALGPAGNDWKVVSRQREAGTNAVPAVPAVPDGTAFASRAFLSSDLNQADFVARGYDASITSARWGGTLSTLQAAGEGTVVAGEVLFYYWEEDGATGSHTIRAITTDGAFLFNSFILWQGYTNNLYRGLLREHVKWLHDVSFDNNLTNDGRFADDAAALAYLVANKAYFQEVLVDILALGGTTLELAYFNTTSDTVRIGEVTFGTDAVPGVPEVPGEPTEALAVTVYEDDNILQLRYAAAAVAGSPVVRADNVGEVIAAFNALNDRGVYAVAAGGAADAAAFSRAPGLLLDPLGIVRTFIPRRNAEDAEGVDVWLYPAGSQYLVAPSPVQAGQTLRVFSDVGDTAAAAVVSQIAIGVIQIAFRLLYDPGTDTVAQVLAAFNGHSRFGLHAAASGDTPTGATFDLARPWSYDFVLSDFAPDAWEEDFSQGVTVTLESAFYALGPPQNVFTANTEALAQTARNTYAAANPSWRSAYQADQRLFVLVRWGAGGNEKATVLLPDGVTWRDLDYLFVGKEGQMGLPGGGAIEPVGIVLDLRSVAIATNVHISTGFMLGERGTTPIGLYRLEDGISLLWWQTDALYDLPRVSAGDASVSSGASRNSLLMPESAGSSLSGNVRGGLTADNELTLVFSSDDADTYIEFFRQVPSGAQSESGDANGSGLTDAERAELTRLSGVETDATADQTAGQIATLLDGLIGDAEWRTRLSGAELVAAIDAAVGNAIWRSAHTVQRNAQQIVDLLDVALGGDGWRTGGGGGGGFTVGAATDAAGALLATLAQFSYDENDDTLTFVPSPPHMQVVRTPDSLLISGAGVAGGPFGTAGVIPTVDPDGPGAMSSAQAEKLASVAGGANQLIPYKIGNIYRAFAAGAAVVKPGNDEGTVTAAGITDPPDNWLLARPEATVALPYVYDCHVYGYLTNGLFGVQYGTPNRTDRYIAPGGPGIDMAAANVLIQMALAAAVTGNTETGIAVTHNADGTLDFVVAGGTPTPTPSDDLYFGTSADAIPEPAEATIDGVAGRGTIPIYDGLLHQLIFQLASETDITSAVRSDDSTMSNLLAGFTKYGDTVIPAGETEPFDVWVSNQALSNPSAFDWIVS